MTALCRHRLPDDVACAGRRIGAPVPFGVVSGGISKGRRNRNDHGRSRRSKKQIFHDTVLSLDLSRWQGGDLSAAMPGYLLDATRSFHFQLKYS